MKHRNRFLILLLSLTLLAVGVSPIGSRAQAGGQAAPSTTDKQAEFVPGHVLVRFRPGAAAASATNSKKSVAARVAALSTAGREIPLTVENFDGSQMVEGLRLARVAPEDTLAAVEALKQRPDVLYAEPDYVWHKAQTPNVPSFGQQYALQKISAPQAWDRTTGSSGIVVAVIDGGVDISHPDLQANIWTSPGEVAGNGTDDDGDGFVDDVHGWDFVHDDNSVFDGEAGDEHGTHVAGIVGASGNNGVGVTGVNWQVSILPVKVLGPQGGSVSDIIKGYNYVRTLRERGVNVRVTNNSYGGPGFSQAAYDAISQLNQDGILFVAAAGNDSEDDFAFPHYPADYDLPNVISVASTDAGDNVSSFSDFGARGVTVAAPGSNILSTIPPSMAAGLGLPADTAYASFSGTSMASPHVAGAAALALSANPNLSAQNLRGVLAYTGDVLPSLQGETTTGRRLNVASVVAAALRGDATPPAPASNLQVTTQSGRALTLRWTAPGDDGSSGTAADYDFTFVNTSGGRLPLPSTVLPAAAGSTQGATLTLPYRNFSGTVELRAYDASGNFSTASVAVTLPQDESSDPYTVTEGPPEALSTGGTPLGLSADDSFAESYPLPFDFWFYGSLKNSVTVSTNGALYFSTIPRSFNGGNVVGLDAQSSVRGLQGQQMIAGLWDDLRTDRGGDVFVTKDSSHIVFRWQAVTFDRGEVPVNFEIELRSDGKVITRYGAGQSAPTNTNLLPVVGISGGEPDAYSVASHTSETAQVGLTNAQTVTFVPRASVIPRHTISGHVTAATGGASADIAGITINLTGSDSRTTQTDASGSYRFQGVADGGSYTVTPSQAGVVFTPASATFNNLSQNQTADFTVARKTFTIGGRVQDTNGNGIADAVVVLSKAVPDSPLGIPTFSQSDASGNFSFLCDPGANYTVSASKPGYVFSQPNSYTFNNLSANQTVIFSARLPQISGHVLDAAGAPVSGATVSLSGASSATFTTGADGSYLFANLPRGNYTLTASKASFDPAFFSISDLTADVTADLSLLRFVKVSGVVTDPSGSPLNGTTILDNGNGVIATGPDGAYTIRVSVAANAPATITAQKNDYTFTLPSVTLSNPDAGDQVVNFAASFNGNPIDITDFFVRQHYNDFLGRDPDTPGLQFWTNNIESCGAIQSCRDVKRVDTSAAFFLSIEFQQTGNLVYKMYKAAFGNLAGKPVAVRRASFIADTRRIQSTPGQVIVGQGSWQAQLEANKQAFALDFVQRAAFQQAHAGQDADAYVNSLFANAGVTPSSAESSAAADAYNNAAAGGVAAQQAAALRSVAESNSVSAKLFDESFVLMQYFGYLQRDPDASPDKNFDGYNFWLQKLNQFNGDYRAAEMVKAFISADEYRKRFGQ
ncbi:MAG TPA: S8 family serine peptidase [Pyrinomonadaceae bacterium]|nr:S8 family serine peptidase [Pyrinomonadaceae bacterium]